MKIKFLLLVFCFLFLVDCATYWNNRRKDFKLAPLNVGFLFVGGDTEPGKKDLGEGVGLRGGSFSSYFSQQLVFGWLGGETFYAGELELAEDGKIQYENKIPLVKDPRDNIKSHSLKYISILTDPPKERKKEKKESR